jgi:hypothetical protein
MTTTTTTTAKVTASDVVSALKQKLASDARWATRAMLLIHKHQTDEEQASSSTNEHNAVGFNSNDAYILTQFVESFGRYQSLTPKMLAIVFKKMPKYAGQVIRHVGREPIAKSLGLA